MRCGIVGAGRARSGLGPFLASFVEAAGGEIVAISGRDAERTRLAADHLAARLGHPIASHGSIGELLGSSLDALIIATPDEAHLDALRAVADAGIPVLCEKPIVVAEQQEHLADVLQRFRRGGVLLMEQCQWPCVLPIFDELHPSSGTSPSEFAMRLSPADPGESMLRGSLSHFLSILQARTAVDGSTAVENLTFEGRGTPEDGLTTRFVLRHAGPGAAATCRLELQVCPEQPRPAWIEIDGRRMERVIDMDSYEISFVAGERTISADDPARTLVYRFADSVREPNIERTRAESDRIEHRARLYHRIIGGFVDYLAGRG